MLEIERVAFGPAMRALVPVERHAGIAALDAGMVEDRHQPVEIGGGGLGEKVARAQRDVGLAERVGRHGRRERGEAGKDGGHWLRAPGIAKVPACKRGPRAGVRSVTTLPEN